MIVVDKFYLPDKNDNHVYFRLEGDRYVKYLSIKGKDIIASKETIEETVDTLHLKHLNISLTTIQEVPRVYRFLESLIYSGIPVDNLSFRIHDTVLVEITNTPSLLKVVLVNTHKQNILAHLIVDSHNTFCTRIINSSGNDHSGITVINRKTMANEDITSSLSIFDLGDLFINYHL